MWHQVRARASWLPGKNMYGIDGPLPLPCSSWKKLSLPHKESCCSGRYCTCWQAGRH